LLHVPIIAGVGLRVGVELEVGVSGIFLVGMGVFVIDGITFTRVGVSGILPALLQEL